MIGGQAHRLDEVRAQLGDDEHLAWLVVLRPRLRPRPAQNPFAERLIGSVRRELLDHVIVLGETHLRRRLDGYFQYYHRSRTHLSLGEDAPETRTIDPLELGRVLAIPEVGGLHHRYARRAA